MILSYLESPYAATGERTVGQHVSYAQEVTRDLLKRGHAPFASHLIYPQIGILDDLDPEERRQGILAGQEWADKADCRVFAIDYGMSPGMVIGLYRALAAEQEILVWSRGLTHPMLSDIEIRVDIALGSVTFFGHLPTEPSRLVLNLDIDLTAPERTPKSLDEVK